MPVFRVASEPALKPTLVDDIDVVRLASEDDPQGLRLVSRVETPFDTTSGEDETPCRSTLTVLVRNPYDLDTHIRVLQALGIKGDRRWA